MKNAERPALSAAPSSLINRELTENRPHKTAHLKRAASAPPNSRRIAANSRVSIEAPNRRAAGVNGARQLDELGRKKRAARAGVSDFSAIFHTKKERRRRRTFNNPMNAK